MCGIGGIVGTGAGRIPPVELDLMLRTLGRRGPDEHGTMVFPNCALLHTRLSIIDLSTGQQPMRDTERNAAVAFNGEIYNFKELRADLVARGHQLATQSDTEVILKAYVAYGVDFVDRLDGMFAFAIWDESAQRLLLARDRFGKKPLYYAFDADRNLLFASEIKTLIASGRIRGAIDAESLDTYLRLTYLPPDRTIYRNVEVVKPAETVVYEGGRLARRRYWALRHAPVRVSYDEAKEEVRRLLFDSVRKRLIADVEIGALLSGGVDSTLVTQVAQACATKPLKTFSVGYGDYINELPYSQAAAERIGTDHHVLQVGGQELSDGLRDVAAYFDEPHADTSNVAQHLVSKLASTKVKVALCGDGGDEVFLGYAWYWRHWNRGRAARLRQIAFSSAFRDYLSAIEVFDASQRRSLWNGRFSAREQALPGASKNRFLSGGVAAINEFDLSVYLPGQLLVKADRAGMMNSLEVRSPLLDYRLAEFVFNLPVPHKTDRRRGKLILKDLLAETMPRDFVDRPKQGFGAPVAEWLRTICRPLARDIFDSSSAAIYTFFDRDYIRGIVDQFYSGQDPSHRLRIWALLCLELWHDAHKGSLT